MFKLFSYFGKKEWLYFGASLLLVVAQALLDLKLPDYMSSITALVQTEGSEMSAIWAEGGKMLLCALLSLLAAFATGYCASFVGASFARILRKKQFDRIEEYGLAEIKKFSISSLITRVTNDIVQVQMFLIRGIQLAVKAPVLAVIAITKINGKGDAFAIIAAIGVAIVMTTIVLLIVLVLPKFKIYQTLVDNLNRVTREGLTGVRVVRAYNAEAYQETKFEKSNKDITDTGIFIDRAMGFISPVISTVMAGMSLAIYWVGAILINEAGMMDKITIFSDTVVFTSYAVQVISAFLILVFVFIMYPRASVSYKRIDEVLSLESSIKSGTVKSDKTEEKGIVQFENVSFRYPDADECVIKNITFTAHPGETIAIIGSTGSGKSTIVNLLPRFYDVTEGKILIDGNDIRDLDLKYLRSKIGYVSQKAFLMKGTIAENITFGEKNGQKIQKSAVSKAIKIAQAEEFVNKMEKNIDSDIAQSGTNISGGQKQRLSIARALARDSEIYIFDDTFSALDYRTDKILRDALNKYTKHATKFIVAQRIGTIREADQILVIEQGKCVGIGKHEELLKNCKVYREIAESQLTKEELGE